MVLHEEFQVLVKALKQKKEKIELLSWQELMELRQKVGEDVDVRINEKLSQYEEKIAMKQKFQSLGIPTAQVAFSSRKVTTEDLENKIKNVLKTGGGSGKSWVAKASHLTTGNSVYIIHADGTISVPNPVGPGKSEMSKHQNGMKMENFGEVSQGLVKTLDIDAGATECRALRECSRGILIESYFPHMLEVRIVSIFGTVIVGGTDSGLKIDRLGSMLKGTSQQWIKSLWTCMVSWSEALAQGTDYLRVDFFVQENQGNVQCIVSEMNAFPWPHSTFFQGTLELQRKAYLKGLVSENSA